MNNNIDIVISALFEHFSSTIYADSTIQIFNTRNIVGDEMETIYEKDSITIDWCDGYGYYEVLGLSSEEFGIVTSMIQVRNLYVEKNRYWKRLEEAMDRETERTYKKLKGEE